MSYLTKMSTDQLFQFFTSATQSSKLQNPCLAEVIRKQMEEAARTTSDTDWPRSDCCLLSGLGEFLVQASLMLSRLADGVANGQHISQYIDDRIQGMEEGHDPPESGFFDHMNEKYYSLKCVNLPSSFLVLLLLLLLLLSLVILNHHADPLRKKSNTRQQLWTECGRDFRARFIEINETVSAWVLGTAHM